ncbi:radical SAM protein [Candidatus Lokiarchaeum ossiferum]|uniref:radical SAM protein n=1 Tax=Candidatus Lokiarchaeum ossiferum TaxID=2951803 RepID=UPI00352F5334
MVNYEPKYAKSILNKMKYIDSWFWCRYTLNAYNGCEHACTYCDARSDRYYLHQDFDKKIYVKTNAANLLDSKLKNARSLEKDVIAMAGTSDGYQPAEKTAENTKKILQVILKHGFPVNISTKNKLIVRDLDIFSEIAKKSWANIAFTITSVDQDLTNFLEPRASTIEERFSAIKKISHQFPDIKIGINLMPIIPLLHDDHNDLEELIQKGKEAGAQYILFAPGVTLRDNQGKYFLQRLKKYLERQNKIDLFHQFVSYFGPEGTHPQAYYHQKNMEIWNLCQKYDMNIEVPRWIPSDYRKENYKAAEILLTKARILKFERKPFKDIYWAGMNINNLKQPLGQLHKQGKLKDILKSTTRVYSLIQPYIKTPTSLDKFF